MTVAAGFFCLGPFIYLLQKTFKLFAFPIFCLLTFLIKSVEEIHHASNFVIYILVPLQNTLQILHDATYIVMAVIVWYLDIQLPMQSVPITTAVVCSTLAQGEVCNIM